MSADKPRLPSNITPNLAGRSLYVPAVVGGIPMSFLYDTGANLTYIDQGMVDDYGLKSYLHDCCDKEGKGIEVKTVDGSAMSSTCTVTDMIFQGAPHQTVHIFPRKELIFLLGTDVTKPMESYPQWELVAAKKKSVNGIFKTCDDKNKKFMCHTLTKTINLHSGLLTCLLVIISMQRQQSLFSFIMIRVICGRR
jgi:hypothetical protein